MKRCTVWLSAALLSLAACSGDNGNDSQLPGPGDADAGESEPPPPPEDLEKRTAFVISHVQVPTSNTEAKELGLDLDGDGEIDNGLGTVIATISSISGDLDVQAELSAGLNQGVFILLADLSYDSLNSGAGVLRLFSGENPSTEPCDGELCGQHFNGTTAFGVTVDSPTDNNVNGSLNSGVFDGSGGKIAIPFPVGANPVDIEVIGAAAIADVTQTTMSEGILAGGITEDEINNTLLPAVADMLFVSTYEDCQGTAPDCCTPGTNGAQIMDFLDENGDCTITSEELQNNFLLSTLLAPDLDLLDENGDYKPGVDGELDSLSVGVGFDGVGATFTAP